MNISYILIVDGASTSASYAPLFRAYGIPCIHLFSDPVIASHFGAMINQQDYVACLTHQGDITQTLERLSKWQISAVLHGLDSALAVAGAIANALNLTYVNEPELNLARRHKFEMIETVRKAGLRAPEQILSDNIQVILNWVGNRNQYPVIIKPVESAGVKGVFKCSSIKEVHRYFNKVMNSSSYYEEPNTTVLIQSFLAGKEYILDSVSLNGKHYLTSIWLVKRDNGSSPFLDNMETVDHTLPKYTVIREYATAVLNALGVRNGPSHLEVILTENGPALVELNCRLHGSLDLRLTTYACGRNHVQDVVTSLLSPDYFMTSCSHPLSFYGQAMHVLLRSPLAGRKLRKDYWSRLETLSSFVSYKSNLPTEGITPKTKDLNTAIGTLSLFNRDSKQLATDLLLVRHEENTGAMYKQD
ncbi:ATP-grasp domain-containing protein [Serratia fonticola]|uniref:ATP-grasp domain-containing protein n=1 Tax=Serratia fonticola TaxID=47917 RepID=UPI0015C64E05|nr:ATP-grasp domain-containing protein [Serratia fonticola]NYA45889.1 ATP-grasp domain-containing protein [Serratia fonticola]